MRHWKKIIFLTIALIIGIGSISLMAARRGVEADFAFTWIENPNIVHEARVYASDHVFGNNETLDTLFEAGNTRVTMVAILYGRHIGVVEFWSDDGLFSKESSGCSFGQHVGPFTGWDYQSIIRHIGGGSWGGTWCVRLGTLSARCDACGTGIRETTSEVFLCFSC